MPYEIKIENNGAYCRVFGRTSIAEFILMLEELADHSRFSYLKYRITDLLDVTEFIAPQSQLMDVLAIEYAQSLKNNYLVKADVAKDSEILKLLKYWQQENLSSSRSQIFDSVEAARDWTNLSFRN